MSALRCSTCRHWITHPDFGPPARDLRTCNSPKTAKGYHSELPTGGIIVEDDEGWGIEVSADFGCVNHEPKTEGASSDEEEFAHRVLRGDCPCAQCQERKGAS